MKKWFVVFMIMITYFSTGVNNRAELPEIQITSGENNQGDSSIYGNIVVWGETRDGKSGTYGCNLSTQSEFHITVEGKELTEPKIYGNIVVGTNWDNGYAHIYGYDISTSKGFRMSEVGSYKFSLRIFGNIAVWEDDRNGSWDIYGYDLSTKKEFQITDEDAQQWQPPYMNQKGLMQNQDMIICILMTCWEGLPRKSSHYSLARLRDRSWKLCMMTPKSLSLTS
jgi:beta propeller repeat protein